MVERYNGPSGSQQSLATTGNRTVFPGSFYFWSDWRLAMRAASQSTHDVGLYRRQNSVFGCGGRGSMFFGIGSAISIRLLTAREIYFNHQFSYSFVIAVMCHCNVHPAVLLLVVFYHLLLLCDLYYDQAFVACIMMTFECAMLVAFTWDFTLRVKAGIIAQQQKTDSIEAEGGVTTSPFLPGNLGNLSPSCLPNPPCRFVEPGNLVSHFVSQLSPTVSPIVRLPLEPWNLVSQPSLKCMPIISLLLPYAY